MSHKHITTTRQVYDHSASLYVNHLGTELSERFETSDDQSKLNTFADDVLAAGGGPVLDVGCGPGRATAHLARRGIDVSGIDLSPAMVAAAQAAHPTLSFDVGSLTTLGVGDSTLAAAVYWYSIIHTPLEALDAAWAELARALMPQGRALFAFQSGQDDHVERTDAFGSSATLTRYHHNMDNLCASLIAMGFRICVRSEREPALPHETHSQAFVIVQSR